MGKHTTHLCRNTIQNTLERNGCWCAYRFIAPSSPAPFLSDIFKKNSERLRSRKNA